MGCADINWNSGLRLWERGSLVLLVAQGCQLWVEPPGKEKNAQIATAAQRRSAHSRPCLEITMDSGPSFVEDSVIPLNYFTLTWFGFSLYK